MSSICFYFQVHQPYRVRHYRHWDIGSSDYFDSDTSSNINNKNIMHKVANKSYLPANQTLFKLLEAYPEFKISFSISGIALEQFEKYSPETLDSFIKLAETGRVEFLSETYYHSLSFLYSKKEFDRQVKKHRRAIEKLFGQTPNIFRNTELIYSNELGAYLASMGYRGTLAEGADHILGWRSPNFLYSLPGNGNFSLLLKNYKLSDDIAFRFSEKTWKEYPLTSGKFAAWVNKINGSGQVVNLFMDYETFGEHQWEDTGIFNFLTHLPRELLAHPDNDFVTPSEAIARYSPFGELDVNSWVSWADVERDLSAWLSNAMQRDAIAQLYSMEKKVLSSRNRKLIEDWRRLTTSDHFYYMCTKWFADGDVHKYFNPYESPYDAFRYFMNVLSDINLRLEGKAHV